MSSDSCPSLIPIPSAQSIESVRLIEAQATKLYWQVWPEVPVPRPRKERRVHEHWRCFGSRISPDSPLATIGLQSAKRYPHLRVRRRGAGT